MTFLYFDMEPAKEGTIKLWKVVKCPFSPILRQIGDLLPVTISIFLQATSPWG